MIWAFLSSATAVKPPHDVIAIANEMKAITMVHNVAAAAPSIPKVEVFPVPTSSRCVVIMVCQYMIIYTALAVWRTYNQCYYTTPLVRYKTRALTQAAQTMTYAPMLCVLFMACRMRVEFLSDGKDE